MRTNFVLIDAENVKPEYIEKLNHDYFRVVVFVGAQQKCLNFEVVNAVQALGANGSYVQVSRSGRDALDFHIAYYIGKLAAENAGAYFHIIAGDKGYDALIDHLKTKKIFCCRRESVLSIPWVKSAAKLTPEQRAADFYKIRIASINNRPTTVKALQNAILSHFHKLLSPPEVGEVIEALKATGYVVLNEENVAYPNQG